MQIPPQIMEMLAPLMDMLADIPIIGDICSQFLGSAPS